MKPSLKLAGRAVLPAIAVSLIGFAVVTAQHDDAGAQQSPIVDPAQAGQGMGAVVAAVGIVEPSSETISVATELPGVVREVFVRPGQTVATGAPLFRLDARALDANIAATRASVQIAEVEARDATARAALFEDIGDNRAISTDERDRARYAADRANANLRLARAQVQQLEVDRARLTVRAPIAGEVLAVNVRVGEFAQAGPAADPLIAIGDTSPLHVRVQIDEEDISRVAAGAAAQASLRGAGDRRAELTFVRFEPLVEPKRNLSGGAERVDTRVVEAIYSLNPEALPAFVGQQMDVFVAARAFGPPAPTSQGTTP
jgi:multidrug efflux pump subunit AcrA (membrane-fusion protein)